MRTHRSLLVLVSLTQTVVTAQAAGQPPLKVLFIGNSYTSVNDLPSMIVGLSGATKTMNFEAWCKQHRAGLAGGLSGAYFDIAKELGAEVAPVGVAWKKALAADKNMVFHRSDKSHPNPTGSYLAACVFYATLLGKSPVGLLGEIKKDEKFLVQLPADQARRLQAIAWGTVQEAKPASLALIDNDRLEEAAAKGRTFLADLFDPALDLLPEYRGSTTYWLFHDNYLAAKMLREGHPEISQKIVNAIQSYGVRESGKKEGGWITGYDANGRPRGLANVETTSMAILALEAVKEE